MHKEAIKKVLLIAVGVVVGTLLYTAMRPLMMRVPGLNRLVA